MRKRLTPSAFMYPEVNRGSDEELRAALERLAQNADGVPPLSIERWVVGAFLKAFEGSQHIGHGKQLLFYQRLNKGGEDLGRCCAVRVDDIREVRGALKEFFKT